MASPNRKRILKGIVWLSLGFVLLFCFRLAYGYTKTVEDNTANGQYFSEISENRRNYASKGYAKKMSGGGGQVNTIQVDQKYEKVAQIKSRSTEFNKEEKTVRNQIKSQNALIQFEQKSGNTGNRSLNLLIGVPPENFDSLYNQLIKIGTVLAKDITKKDKTNEYRELNARKASLEKVRNSLIALKEKGGRIDEYMSLENRILDIEEQLQGLGVSLGDFDQENEFCTVKFSLLEGRVVSISLMHRFKVAFEWTVKLYFRLMMTLFFLVGLAYLFLLLIDKLKLLQVIFNNRDNS